MSVVVPRDGVRVNCLNCSERIEALDVERVEGAGATTIVRLRHACGVIISTEFAQDYYGVTMPPETLMTAPGITTNGART